MTPKSIHRMAPYHLNAIQQQCHKSIRQISSLDATLQIGDIAPDLRLPYFTYQDLTVHYILEHFRKTQKKLLSYSMYTPRRLEQRWHRQQHYYEKVAGVFTMSDWLRNYLIENNLVPPDKIYTVHAGINVQPSPLQEKDRIIVPDIHSEKMIMFIGRDFERKGGYSLLRAFEILRHRYHSSVTLVIAGPSTPGAIGLNKGLPEKVQFLGDAPYSILAHYLSKADVFCMPSHFEAFGIVFVEALSAGVPCIGRNCYAMPEIIRHGDNGYLLSSEADVSDEPELLCDLLIQSLDNSNMRTRVWNNRANIAQYYSWQRVANDMATAIQQSINR